MKKYAKKQQKAFLDAIDAYLQGREVLDTAYGPYTVACVDADERGLNFMGRFEDVDRLKGLPSAGNYVHRWIGDTQVNGFSGKWNFHFVDPETWSGEQAAAKVVRCLEMVKSAGAVAEARAFEEEA